MLKPWHIKALWFKAALQDVLLEGQKSLTAVQWQQMCSMWVPKKLVAAVPYTCLCIESPTIAVQALSRAMQVHQPQRRQHRAR